MDPNNLYLRSSEGRCYVMNRQEAMLIGEIRTLLEKPGGKDIRIIYCKNVKWVTHYTNTSYWNLWKYCIILLFSCFHSDQKMEKICVHLELMIRTMKKNNTLNLSLQLETKTKTPLVVCLRATDYQILQSMVYNKWSKNKNINSSNILFQ